MPDRTMFQRRHYQAVADILNTANRDAAKANDLFAVTLVEGLAEQFANMFKADNARFSEGRFADAVRK